MKKGLLILFGEWRNFDSLSYQLENEVKDFDVIISTWNYTYGDIITSQNAKKTIELTKEHILETFPYVKDILIHNVKLQKKLYPINLPWMVFHWKKTLDYIQDDYEIVVLHRFEVLSNLSKLFLNPIDKHTLYYDDGAESKDGCKWIQDWILVGSPYTIKSWIDRLPVCERIISSLPDGFEIKQRPDPHYILGYYIGLWDNVHKSLSEHFDKFFYVLVKEQIIPKSWLESLKEMGIKFFELDMNSNIFRKVVKGIEETWVERYLRDNN